MNRLLPLVGLLAALTACDVRGATVFVDAPPTPGAPPTGDILSVDAFSDGCVVVDTDDATLVRLGYATPGGGGGWAGAFSFVPLQDLGTGAWIGDLPAGVDVFFVTSDTDVAPASWADPGTWFVLPAAP